MINLIFAYDSVWGRVVETLWPLEVALREWSSCVLVLALLLTWRVFLAAQNEVQSRLSREHRLSSLPMLLPRSQHRSTLTFHLLQGVLITDKLTLGGDSAVGVSFRLVLYFRIQLCEQSYLFGQQNLTCHFSFINHLIGSLYRCFAPFLLSQKNAVFFWNSTSIGTRTIPVSLIVIDFLLLERSLPTLNAIEECVCLGAPPSLEIFNLDLFH